MKAFLTQPAVTFSCIEFFDSKQLEEIKKMQSLMRKEKLGILSSQWLAILIRKYPVVYEEMLIEKKQS